MSEQTTKVAVQPGTALVARRGDAVLVIEADGADERLVTAALALLENPHDGRRSALDLAALVISAGGTAPRFGFAYAGPDGTRLLLHGATQARADGFLLDGAESTTWADRVLPGALAGPLTVSLLDAAAPAGGYSDLGSGTVAGSGFTLWPLAATAPSAPAAPVAPEPPVVPEPAVPPQPAAPPVLDADTVNGTTQLRAPAASAPAAPIHLDAVLAVDDGRRLPLDRNYVLGRDPFRDQAVQAGAAAGVQLDDGENLISRVQAHIVLDAGVVLVYDAQSGNGTYVAAPGAPEWSPVPPEGSQLPLGWSLRVGRRVLTHIPVDH